MTIEELTANPKLIAAMSDADLMEYFAPVLNITRPVEKKKDPAEELREGGKNTGKSRSNPNRLYIQEMIARATALAAKHMQTLK